MEGFVSLATKMGIGEAGITAIFGYLVVFVGLSLLMLVIYLIGAGFQASAKKRKPLQLLLHQNRFPLQNQKNRRSQLHRVLLVM